LAPRLAIEWRPAIILGIEGKGNRYERSDFFMATIQLAAPMALEV
jgi:hypothetical protein